MSTASRCICFNGSSILYNRKKDEALQMVVDHRALNKQTLSNHYPLSHVGDLFDQLVGASAFDL